MTPDARRARDIDLLDTIDAFKREPFDATVWRVVRKGVIRFWAAPLEADGVMGRSTYSIRRLSEQDGAIAEIYALLSLQPVFPSKLHWPPYQLKVSATQTLKLADLPTLSRLGVDVARYSDRTYDRTQEIADAAYFLGFDGLVAPSARWACLNLILFTDRIPPEQIAIVVGRVSPIAWDTWRKRTRRDTVQQKI